MRKSTNQSLRLLFDASPLLVNKTGVAYYTERLILALSENYPDTTLTGFFYNFMGKRPTDHFPAAPHMRFYPVRFLPSKILYQLRRWGIELPVEMLCSKRADFILYPNFLGYPSWRGTPSACVVHDLTFIDLPEYVAAKNGSDLRRFVPQQIKRSSFVITVSEFTKQKISDFYAVPPENIIVTPIPPEPPRSFPAAQQTAALHKQGITKPYLLFLSTIEPRKNIINLLAAYQLLPDHIRDSFTLVLAGRVGWNCEAEVAAIAAARRDGYDVLHLGYVDEDTRAILYQNATLFTIASHYEGFGMPILEASSYGVPCAVSDIPVFREVGGDHVAYFDESDPVAIKQIWEALLADPHRMARLGKAGKRHADSYKWSDSARLVHDAIMKHLSR